MNYYSSGGSSGGWYSSGGSWGGSSGGASIGSAYQKVMPAQPKATPEKPAPPKPAKETSASTATADALLAVSVPEDAKVFVNNQLTKTPGTERTFVSRGLTEGFDYTYQVRAEIMRDGQKIVRSRVVNLRAGQRAEVDFDFASAEQQAETTLTVYVPEDAEVFLAGAPTKSKGKVRQFRTARLAPGESWKDYTVKVTLDRQGKPVTQERTITLVGGKAQELSFSFDRDKVALAR